MEELRPDQKEFAEKYLDNGGNATQAVKEVYNPDLDDNGAAVKGSRLLRNIKVREYLEEKAEIAASNVFHLANKARNEAVKLSANKDILDRAGFKPVERKDITSDGKPLPILNVHTNDSDQQNTEDDQEIESNTRGVISKQDSINTVSTDSTSAERQETNADEHSLGILSSLKEGSDEGLQEHNEGTQVLER